MIYNFTSAKLNPRISCSVPSSEGYEITNLVSSKSHERNKGFIAYPSIRTPIEIEICFICSVHIQHILIWPSVGAQKSVGFELQVRNGKFSDYQVIAYGFINNKESGILFYNGRLVNDKKVNKPHNFMSVSFKSTQWMSLLKCEQLKLRILRTENSVPCLSKIEVWGTVSNMCNNSLKENIQQIYFSNDSNHCELETKNVEETFQNTLQDPKVSNNTLEIPDEFLDAITFEVMSLPFTLPSGNTVDKSTLDKHVKNQEVWNRQPFDPFTGTIFTSNSFPILNSALKNRIDCFLLLNQDRLETKMTARTVGKCNNGLKNDSSSLTKSNFHNSRKRNYDLALSESCRENEDRNIDLSDENLETSLKSVLEKLPRYSLVESNEVLNIVNCCKCLKTESLYKLDCGHLLCRPCVQICLNITDNKCSKCEKTIIRNKIVKYNA